MKKGERVLCLKRQLSDILGFRLTVILSTRYEYLSKKPQPPGHTLPHSPGLFVCLVFTFGQDILLYWDEFSLAGFISKI